jgi:hypothetical protein
MGTAEKRNERARRSSQVVTVVVALVLLLGGLALTGFVVRLRGLVAVPVSAQLMWPGVAAMLIVAAVALWLVAPETAGSGRRRCGQAMGVVVALFGVVVLVEYAFGWRAGVDDVLFQDLVWEWKRTGIPGRPAPHTAVAFVAVGLGVALLDVDRERGFRPAAVLAPAGALVASIALLGQAYGLVYLSGASVNYMPYNSRTTPRRASSPCPRDWWPAGRTGQRLGCS